MCTDAPPHLAWTFRQYPYRILDTDPPEARRAIRDAIDKAVKEWDGFIHGVARKTRPTPDTHDLDDLAQELRIHLAVYVLPRFNPRRAKLVALLSTALTRQAWKVRNRQRRHRLKETYASLDDLRLQDNHRPWEPADSYDIFEELEDRDTQRIIHRITHTNPWPLSKKTASVLRVSLNHPTESHPHLARRLGCAPSNVSHHLREAERRLSSVSHTSLLTAKGAA